MIFVDKPKRLQCIEVFGRGSVTIAYNPDYEDNTLKIATISPFKVSLHLRLGYVVGKRIGKERVHLQTMNNLYPKEAWLYYYTMPILAPENKDKPLEQTAIDFMFYWDRAYAKMTPDWFMDGNILYDENRGVNVAIDPGIETYIRGFNVAVEYN